MLMTITGTISEKLAQSVIVEAAGLGYEVWLSREDYEACQTGAQGRFYLYEIIREDAHDLYGFGDLGARRLFEQLLSVSGVGPKAALAILSVSSLDNVRDAIASSDMSLLQSASGIGKRTAERIIVELKSKVGGSGIAGVDATALEALQALGYPTATAVQALAGLPKTATDEERIKLALQELGR